MTYTEARARYYEVRREFERARDDYYATPFWNLVRRWALSGRMLELAEELGLWADELERIVSRAPEVRT